ncbi:MAG: SbcC/MukB-like Walker B domain-containing protein, partial [Dehalococcoidia bacterium]|nr:SbcC/MukB-like Walker B domain-containing protein [Dehalococcoidia bacterium]
AAVAKGLAEATAALAIPSEDSAEPVATVAAARERLSRLDTLAGQLDSASGERQQAERALKRVQALTSKAEKARNQAEATLAGAERAHAASRAAFDGARMQQAAATLQRELQPGDPCPVCGEPVGEVPQGDFPDLDDAERALSDAATTLTQARTASAVAAEATAKTAAAASHGAEVLETALVRLAALGSELAQLEVKPGGAPDASASLRDGLELYELAVENARTSSERTVQTSEQRKGEQRAVAAAGSGRQRAAKALAAVEQRVAAASVDQPEGAGDLASLRDALAQSERRAARARELDAAIAAAGVVLAEAGVRHEERDRERDRLAGEFRERAAAAAAAEQAETAARSAFEAVRAELAQEGLLDAADVPDVAAVESLFRGLDGEAKQSAEALGGLRERIERARIEAEDATRLRAEVQQQERAASIASALAIELHGDRFIAYVQQEALRVLAADASARLHQLTNGRYQLVLDDREFAVIDHLNGDEQRSVKTLSGGETFLTSLALSLALSERLPELAGTGGAVSLESLFLDEGFGSLDADALDVAIEGLEALADPSAGGRLVGVISHVPQLAERLDDRIEVRAGETTSTVLAS